MDNTILISQKLPGLAYAITQNGIELPVLDITHPKFIASINEDRVADVSKASIQKMKALGEMSDAQKRAYYEQLSNSFIYGRFFMTDPDANYLNGMSTYVYKLGPFLIGGGKDRELDRSLSMGIGGVAVRMRIRVLCRMQANVLISQLESSTEKDLCFVNIAGGAASDSINTLILILKENPALLKTRKIEINILDIDPLGPHYAKRCIEALKTKGYHFHGLHITFNHIGHNWKDADGLTQLLSNKKQCIMMCASEGGLFEYGSDDDIIRNLNALYDHSPDDIRVAGTVIHELDKVDPTVPAMTKATHAGLRFLGIPGLSSILEKTNWHLENTMEKNPIYAIFNLKKEIKNAA